MIDNLSFYLNHTGLNENATETRQDEAKAIVVSDYLNKHNYQYLFDELKWVKLNNFPKTDGKIFGIFENNNILSVCVNNSELNRLPSNKKYKWCTSCKFGNNFFRCT